jgi:hypothetical protein
LKGILKWPLIIAAVVVVLRVVTEQSGQPDSVNNLLAVFALHLLIGPIYFAVMIAKSGVRRPYLTLFKLVFIYALLTRLMVLPTYWLARIYEWPQPRFDGLWGPDVTPFTGFVVVPVATALSWIVGSVIFGGAIGSLVLAIARRAAPTGSTGIPSRP